MNFGGGEGVADERLLIGVSPQRATADRERNRKRSFNDCMAGNPYNLVTRATIDDFVRGPGKGLRCGGDRDRNLSIAIKSGLFVQALDL
jgi:hypothetical protein